MLPHRCTAHSVLADRRAGPTGRSLSSALVFTVSLRVEPWTHPLPSGLRHREKRRADRNDDHLARHHGFAPTEYRKPSI
jgi:hypothetical protein